MFKNLLKLWSTEKTLFDQMLEHFETMLAKSERLYRDVTDALFLGGNLPQLRKEVYEEDRDINRSEQLIRRQVVTHLSTGPSVATSLNSSLILMSVVKDVERVGDYAKNMFEVFEKTSKLESGAMCDRLLTIRNTILEAFTEVGACFKMSNEQKARAVLHKIAESKNRCDAIVEELLEQPKEDNAVAHALLARFFKRTLAHLGNIATSVIMPLDKLDYFDEDLISKVEKV